MSIRRVTCPSCNASANVMATMTNIKCPSCGAVWDVNHPVAKKPAAASADSDDRSDPPNIALFAGIGGGVIVMLAIAGMAIALLIPDGKEKKAEPAADVVEEPAPIEYRVVTKLSEETRKKIYSDYRKTASTSIERKVPLIAKDSPTAKILGDTMQKLVKREVTHFALENNVSDDDIMQIVAEGDAKKWPGSKKPKP